MEMVHRTPVSGRADASASRPSFCGEWVVVRRWLAAGLVAALAVACGPRSAIGQTWTGGGTSSSWSESANWTSLPTGTPNLTFGGNTSTNTVNNLVNNVARFYFTNDGSAGKTAAFTITGSAVRPAVGDATLFNTTAITTGGPITDEIALDFVSGVSSIGGATLGANHNLKLSGKLAVGGIGLTSIGTGALIVTNTANTWTGISGVAGGCRIEVAQLLAGVANASGTSSSITIGQFGTAGTLVYIGAGETATKRFTFGNGTSGGSHTGGSNLLNNGSGAIAFSSGTFNIADNTAAARTLTLGGTSSFAAEIQGSIINNGTTGAAAISITKADSGTWVLSGSNAYTGTTRVNGGTLRLGNSGTTGWIGSSSSVILGSTSANFVFARTDGYGGNFDRVISGTGNIWLVSGTLTLTGANTYSGTSTLSAGVVNLGSAETAGTSGPLGRSAAANAGSIVLAGGTLQYSASNTNDYSGRFSTAASQAYNVDTNGQNVTWASNLSSSGGVLGKVGSGTLTLSGSNSLSGGVTVGLGQLRMNNSNALGTGTTTVAGGELNIGSYAPTVGGFTITSGSLTGSGTVTATNGYALNGGTVNASLGSGILSVTADSSLNGTSGATVLNLTAGRLTLGSGSRFTSSSVAVSGSAGAALTLGGNETFGSLDGAANIAVGASTLSVGGLGSSTTYSGNISGAGSLTKLGAGKLTLTGSSSYAGPTTVSTGALAVNGQITSSVSVATGAVLGGSGIIAGNIGGDGLIAPGNSPGILTVNGQLDATASTAFAFELSQASAPMWSDASNSLNDVLRLTATSPFTAPLADTNVVNVYFDVTTLANGDTFLGGFFVDNPNSTANLLVGGLGSSSFQYFVKGDGQGSYAYNDVNYYTFDQYMATHVGITGVTQSVVPVASANFSNGTITTGQVTQFIIVPEPQAVALALCGFSAAGYQLLRRRR